MRHDVPDCDLRRGPVDSGLGPGVRKDVGVRISPLAQRLWDGWKSSGLSDYLRFGGVLREPVRGGRFTPVNCTQIGDTRERRIHVRVMCRSRRAIVVLP
jgi:hypothetical protein